MDLFQCKNQGEALKDYFQKFIQIKAKAQNVPKHVAIEATIKGLCIGPFTAHLAREKPQTIEDLYNEFEKYCRFDNNLRRRLEEQNQCKQFQSNNRNTQKGNNKCKTSKFLI